MKMSKLASASTQTRNRLGFGISISIDISCIKLYSIGIAGTLRRHAQMIVVFMLCVVHSIAHLNPKQH